MNLTERDLELLAKLQTYALLTTRQIGKITFPGVELTTVLRRLRKLERGFYVQRIMNAWGYEAAWGLAQNGANSVGGLTFKRHFRRDVLEHDLKLTRLRLHLEDLGIARSWVPEHEIRSKVAARHGLRRIEERVVPDGIMGVYRENLAESVAIELELSFKNSRRYRRTFREYHTKNSLWAVWYVVSVPSLGRQLAKVWRESTSYSHGPHLLWSVADEVMSHDLAAKIYSRDGSEKLSAVWQAIVKPKPAQTPTQGLSITAQIFSGLGEDGTTEDSDENLAPAS